MIFYTETDTSSAFCFLWEYRPPDRMAGVKIVQIDSFIRDSVGNRNKYVKAVFLF